MEGEQFLVVICSEANQRVVELAYFRLPPTQRIRMRCDFVRMLHNVLKAFDGFLQIVIIAGVDDGFAFNGIAFWELLPQFVDGIVPDDFGDILRLAWLSPPRVVGDKSKFPIFQPVLGSNRLIRDLKDEIVAEIGDGLFLDFGVLLFCHSC